MFIILPPSLLLSLFVILFNFFLTFFFLMGLNFSNMLFLISYSLLFVIYDASFVVTCLFIFIFWENTFRFLHIFIFNEVSIHIQFLIKL